VWTISKFVERSIKAAPMMLKGMLRWDREKFYTEEDGTNKSVF